VAVLEHDRADVGSLYSIVNAEPSTEDIHCSIIRAPAGIRCKPHDLELHRRESPELGEKPSQDQAIFATRNADPDEIAVFYQVEITYGFTERLPDSVEIRSFQRASPVLHYSRLRFLPQTAYSARQRRTIRDTAGVSWVANQPEKARRVD
jgi:hypothetical protein